MRTHHHPRLVAELDLHFPDGAGLDPVSHEDRPIHPQHAGAFRPLCRCRLNDRYRGAARFRGKGRSLKRPAADQSAGSKDGHSLPVKHDALPQFFLMFFPCCYPTPVSRDGEAFFSTCGVYFPAS
jgi:hypothetical protein